MKWSEPILSSISSKNILYFSEPQKNVCERVCNSLKINIFPDLDQVHYWELSNGNWQKYPIKDFQKIDNNTQVFDERVLEEICKAPSNILFVFENNELCGILHFVDFDSISIYNSLYNHFYQFENNLREYLSLKGIKYKSFIEYFEYKKKKFGDYYDNRIKLLKSNKFYQEAIELPNLHKLQLSDLIRFSTSSFVRQEYGFRVGDNKLPVKSILDLRNTIMHSKGFTGQGEVYSHSLGAFTNFFKQVLDFKYIYSLLWDIIRENQEEIRIANNEFILSQYAQMDDNTIIESFVSKSYM